MNIISEREHDYRMALYEQGFDDRTIGLHCGLSDKAIAYWRRKCKLQPNSKGQDTAKPYREMLKKLQTASDVRKHRREGMSIWNAVAEKFNVAPSLAFCHIQRLLWEEEDDAD